MKLTFLGAAGEVTGSSFLLETDDVKVLIDCGMFQGGREAEPKNRARFAFDPKTLDCVLLTHAHIDHSGLLPRLVAAGFRGPVFATRATVDLLRVMLLDATHIQEKEAEWRERAARRGTLACVVMLDLDNFKLVNDRYGHAVGDNVIRALSNLLRQRLRRVDSLGRYGGEEFTAVLPECNLEQAKRILDEIRLRFAELPFIANETCFNVTFSAGIAQSNSQTSASQLIELADQALYAAKAAGRNQVHCSAQL